MDGFEEVVVVLEEIELVVEEVLAALEAILHLLQQEAGHCIENVASLQTSHVAVASQKDIS